VLLQPPGLQLARRQCHGDAVPLHSELTGAHWQTDSFLRRKNSHFHFPAELAISRECARPSGIPAAIVGTCIANRLSALSRRDVLQRPARVKTLFGPNTKKSSEVVKYAIATECKASSRILSDRCREVLADCVTFQQPGIKPVTRVRSPLCAGGGKKYKCRAASLKNNSAAGGSKQTGVPVRRT
jgi:hypothetical protein